jgi:multisubunit Na+/H+ antiporter MnhB subunit
MIAAPGNYVRAGGSSVSLYMLAYRLFNCTRTLLIYCGPLALVTLLMYIVFYRFPNSNKNDNLKLSLIYTVVAIAAIYAMILSPSFPRRALFGVVTFLVTGAGILFYNLDFRHRFLRQAKMLVIVFGLSCFVFAFYSAFGEINSFRKAVGEREAAIKQAKEEGKTSCEFERFFGGTYIHGEDPFSAELMSRYYGIKIELKAPQD